MTRMYAFPPPDHGDEPARDARLATLLRAVVGDLPASEVDWAALAGRVGSAVRAPYVAPWWSHVGQWQHRALPLALAAGLLGALTLANAALTTRDTPADGSLDVVSAVVSGGSAADAARSYSGAVASAVDYGMGMPE
jgi:hypothetical protein